MHEEKEHPENVAALHQRASFNVFGGDSEPLRRAGAPAAGIFFREKFSGKLFPALPTAGLGLRGHERSESGSALW